MTLKPKTTIQIALWAGSLLSFLTAYYFLSRAGCVADLKGASWGDFNAGLAAESQGLSSALVGLLFAVIGVAVAKQVGIVMRAVRAICALVVGMFFVMLFPIFIEISAAQSCALMEPPQGHAVV
jgi:hypothetical protein